VPLESQFLCLNYDIANS